VRHIRPQPASYSSCSNQLVVDAALTAVVLVCCREASARATVQLSKPSLPWKKRGSVYESQGFIPGSEERSERGLSSAAGLRSRRTSRSRSTSQHRAAAVEESPPVTGSRRRPPRRRAAVSEDDPEQAYFGYGAAEPKRKVQGATAAQRGGRRRLSCGRLSKNALAGAVAAAGSDDDLALSDDGSDGDLGLSDESSPPPRKRKRRRSR
jgi:hypothetical protein